MMLWIGLQTPPDLIRSLFGVNSVAEINTEITCLPTLDNDFNEKIRELIYSIRIERRRFMRVIIFIYDEISLYIFFIIKQILTTILFSSLLWSDNTINLKWCSDSS